MWMGGRAIIAVPGPGGPAGAGDHSTVTLFARLRG
jgi:hypothetical protein